MPSLVDYRLTPTAGTNLSVTRSTRLRSGSPRGRYPTNERASAKAGKNPVIDDDEIADRTGVSAQVRRSLSLPAPIRSPLHAPLVSIDADRRRRWDPRHTSTGLINPLPALAHSHAGPRDD